MRILLRLTVQNELVATLQNHHHGRQTHVNSLSLNLLRPTRDIHPSIHPSSFCFLTTAPSFFQPVNFIILLFFTRFLVERRKDLMQSLSPNSVVVVVAKSRHRRRHRQHCHCCSHVEDGSHHYPGHVRGLLFPVLVLLHHDRHRRVLRRGGGGAVFVLDCCSRPRHQTFPC